MMALGRRLECEQVGFVGSILPALSGGLSRNHQLRAGIAGYLSTYNFSNNEEILDYKTQYLKSLTVEDLKNICKGAELKTTLKKAQLIEQNLSKECDLKIPTAVAKNDNFDSMMKKFYHLYIEDIKKTIDSWHPLIIREVWNCVSTDSECEAVGKMAKNILTDPYWGLLGIRVNFYHISSSARSAEL